MSDAPSSRFKSNGNLIAHFGIGFYRKFELMPSLAKNSYHKTQE